MDDIGERYILYYLPGTNLEIPMGGLNPYTIVNTLLVMAVLWGLMYAATRRLSAVPNRGQAALEWVVGAFDNLVASSLEMDKEKNRRFFPLIICMFLFLVLGNFLGFLPGAWFEEPTADLSTTLGLGILGVGIAIVCGIASKGILGYLEELLGPLWQQPGIAGKISALFFFPLNVVSEISKVLSISFRLFGNIVGSAVLLVVISHLVFYLVLPIGLLFFFVFFVGAIQAFVFAMLTLTYISVAIK